MWGLLGQIDSESEEEECSEAQMSEELASVKKVWSYRTFYLNQRQAPLGGNYFVGDVVRKIAWYE